MTKAVSSRNICFIKVLYNYCANTGTFQKILRRMAYIAPPPILLVVILFFLAASEVIKTTKRWIYVLML